MKALIDTNIIIDHLRGIPAATRQLSQVESNYFEGIISTITVMELFAARHLSEKQRKDIESIFDLMIHIPVNGDVALKRVNFCQITRLRTVLILWMLLLPRRL